MFLHLCLTENFNSVSKKKCCCVKTIFDTLDAVHLKCLKVRWNALWPYLSFITPPSGEIYARSGLINHIGCSVFRKFTSNYEIPYSLDSLRSHSLVSILSSIYDITVNKKITIEHLILLVCVYKIGKMEVTLNKENRLMFKSLSLTPKWVPRKWG